MLSECLPDMAATRKNPEQLWEDSSSRDEEGLSGEQAHACHPAALGLGLGQRQTEPKFRPTEVTYYDPVFKGLALGGQAEDCCEF